MKKKSVKNLLVRTGAVVSALAIGTFIADNSIDHTKNECPITYILNHTFKGTTTNIDEYTPGPVIAAGATMHQIPMIYKQLDAKHVDNIRVQYAFMPDKLRHIVEDGIILKYEETVEAERINNVIYYDTREVKETIKMK